MSFYNKYQFDNLLIWPLLVLPASYVVEKTIRLIFEVFRDTLCRLAEKINTTFESFSGFRRAAEFSAENFYCRADGGLKRLDCLFRDERLYRRATVTMQVMVDGAKCWIIAIRLNRSRGLQWYSSVFDCRTPDMWAFGTYLFRTFSLFSWIYQAGRLLLTGPGLG